MQNPDNLSPDTPSRHKHNQRKQNIHVVLWWPTSISNLQRHAITVISYTPGYTYAINTIAKIKELHRNKKENAGEINQPNTSFHPSKRHAKLVKKVQVYNPFLRPTTQRTPKQGPRSTAILPSKCQGRRWGSSCHCSAWLRELPWCSVRLERRVSKGTQPVVG